VSATEWDIRWIMSVLPHRYPLLLVDRVLEMEPKRRIRALKNFTINEEFFVGHFPGDPVVPGVLLIEAMAQAGGILLMHDDPDRARKLLLFMSIDRARFRKPVVPGDQVHLHAKVLRLKANHCKLEAKAYVGDVLHAEAELLSTTVERDAVR
jgi:beta-hydroxyacyl-ACP dehydratase FabZ